MSEKKTDIFAINKIYPIAEDIFKLKLSAVNDIKNSCIVVLDTNALLVPYLTGSDSLKELKKMYASLQKEKRLIVPGQVAREFANNRPNKLKEVFQQLSRKRNGLQSASIGKYPLLEGLSEYKELLKLESKLNEKIVEYRKKIGEITSKMKAWNWDDPVSLVYRSVFSKDVVLDIKLKEDKIKEELSYRFLHKIPPGFKDGNKEDEGMGDFLIWKTILHIGEERKLDLIFVSGDEKTDWYHRVEKQGLYPRFELVSEYQRVSDGKSFHILRLSELLDLLGADIEVVKEVAKEEVSTSLSTNILKELSNRAARAVFNWFLLDDGLGLRWNKEFPDFTVLYDDGRTIGVEVIAVNQTEPFRGISLRVLHKLDQAIESIKNNNWDALQFFIVSDSEGYPFSTLEFSLGKALVKHGGDFGQISFVTGYLDDYDEFVVIR